MAIIIAIAKETTEYEKRVATTPETVKKLIALGATLVVEKGAGEASSFADHLYEAAGATIAANRADAVSAADVVLKVQVGTEDLEGVKKGAILAGLYAPYQNPDVLKAAANKGVNAFSMELVPRITRAQAMDVLSSQSNLAGYKAVLDAAEKIDVLVRSPKPCHQYFTCHPADDAVILMSRDEYDDEWWQCAAVPK